MRNVEWGVGSGELFIPHSALPTPHWLDIFDADEVFDFEHHAARAIVGGEDVGRPDLAETEGRHGCLLVFGIAYRTFDQRHLDIR